MIAFREESWSSLAKDATGGLFRKHWEELALDRDKIELSMDMEKYKQLSDSGVLHIVTARRDGRLVGYFVTFLMIHPHYKDAGLMALTDFYYLLPEERRGGAGAKLVIAMETSLKERGVVKAYLSCKLHEDHTPLFTLLGWKPTDITFTKHLGPK